MEIEAASGLPAFLILLQGLLLFPVLHLNNSSPMIAQEFWPLFSKKKISKPQVREVKHGKALESETTNHMYEILK